MAVILGGSYEECRPKCRIKSKFVTQLHFLIKREFNNFYTHDSLTGEGETIVSV